MYGRLFRTRPGLNAVCLNLAFTIGPTGVFIKAHAGLGNQKGAVPRASPAALGCGAGGCISRVSAEPRRRPPRRCPRLPELAPKVHAGRREACLREPLNTVQVMIAAPGLTSLCLKKLGCRCSPRFLANLSAARQQALK